MSIPELAWFKSSYSGTEGDNCLEVAVSATDATPMAVHVRDSKDTTLPHLDVSPAAWAAMVAHVQP